LFSKELDELEMNDSSSIRYDVRWESKRGNVLDVMLNEIGGLVGGFRWYYRILKFSEKVHDDKIASNRLTLAMA